MNLADDYFSEKYFSDKFLSENFANAENEGQILFFTEVFRRHHVENDPVNKVDPLGKQSQSFSFGHFKNSTDFALTWTARRATLKANVPVTATIRRGPLDVDILRTDGFFCAPVSKVIKPTSSGSIGVIGVGFGFGATVTLSSD